MKKNIVLASLGCLTLGCGDGTIQFGVPGHNGNPQDTAVVEGNIRDVNPQVAGADIVVFVYTDLTDPGTYEHFKKQRSVAVSPDSQTMQFQVTQVESGKLTVVFLQDHPSNPDGTINPGDPVATLNSPNNVLDNASNGETISIKDVDIDFQTGIADPVSVRSLRSGSTN